LKRGERWVQVAELRDLPPGQVRRGAAAGRILALVNLDGAVHAVDAVCPHRGGPLDQGSLWQGKLECPWHHFRYDLETGANTYPANVYPEDLPGLQTQVGPVRVYPVRVEEGRVYVRLPVEAGG